MEKLNKLINDFINDERINNLLLTTTFEIYAKNIKELAHSSFLSSLFDPNTNGEYGDAPLKKFIKIINKKLIARKNEGKTMESESSLVTFEEYIPDSSILLENYKLHNIIAKNEYRDEGYSKFIDIKIDFSYKLDKDNNTQDFSIIVENKVKAKENAEQTKEYFDIIKEIQKDKKNIYIYLTMFKNSKKPKCDEFIVITYDELFEYVIEPLSHSNYKNAILYSLLLDYKRLLLKTIGKDLKSEYIAEIKESHKELIAKIETKSNKSKIINEFISEYARALEILGVKIGNDSYNFSDLGLDKNDRLYFFPISSNINISARTEAYMKQYENYKKYEIYPLNETEVELCVKGRENISFKNPTQLVKYLFKQENLGDFPTENAKSYLYIKDEDKYYSLRQYRHKQLNK